MSQNTKFQWCEYEGVGKFKVASIDDPEYKAALHGSKLALDEAGVNLTDDQEASIHYGLISKYILLDWEGEIVSSSGERVAYSPAWARHLLSTKIDFFLWLMKMSKGA